MLSPQTRRNWRRILPFAIIFLLSGWVFYIVELAAAGSLRDLPDTAIEMDFTIFLFSSIALAGVGLLVGVIELVYLDNVFARHRFYQKILYKLLIYSAVLFLIIGVTYPIAAAIELDAGLFDGRVWTRYLDYLSSLTFLSTYVQLLAALGLSLFYAEISANIGSRTLLNFFSGRYHRPREEVRIFMFLDMRSSTTIAEQLGHATYFRLLKAYYADLADAIVQYGGEVYQYVGDEIIVSWELAAGLRQNNCLRCFFAMRDALHRQADSYLQTYGVAPTFKAGLHFGEVTTGEIGVVKKEIFFTGDVLNATARIQGLCNTYGVDLLLSGELLERLPLGEAYTARALGTSELRGRQRPIELFTVEERK
jgi:adenylate cyclase